MSCRHSLKPWPCFERNAAEQLCVGKKMEMFDFPNLFVPFGRHNEDKRDDFSKNAGVDFNRLSMFFFSSQIPQPIFSSIPNEH